MSSAQNIRLATIDYCPFACDPTKESGKEGFMTDVLREAFEPSGYALQVDIMSYARAVSSVQSGDHDGIVVVGKDYAPNLVYPTMPTVTQRVAFLVNADTKWRYEGVHSLSRVLVGIVKGYHYVDPELIAYLEMEKNNPERVLIMHGQNTTDRGLRMLKAKRISTFLEGEYSAIYELRKLGLQKAVKIAGYTSQAFEDFSAFSPMHPKAEEYAKILSETLTKMKSSGKLDKILQTYRIPRELNVNKRDINNQL